MRSPGKQLATRTTCVAIVVAIFAALECTATDTSFFSVDPTSALLRADGVWAGRTDTPAPPLLLELSSLGFSPSDWLSLTRQGSRSWTPNSPETATSMIGVFSATSELLDHTNLVRIPGAIDAGLDYGSGSTYGNSHATDIPQDFSMDPAVAIQVPAAAEYLFVSTVDSLYFDNKDADNDFGVTVTAIAGLADFDKDNDVDGEDFLIWQTAFPTLDGTATSNTGDATGDGNVDGEDFLVWQNEFGTGVSGARQGAVPEPTAACVALVLLAASPLRRVRR